MKVFKFSRSRKCFRCVAAMVKLEANIEAVILWQSVQLQTKVLSRPGPLVGRDLKAVLEQRREIIVEEGGRRKRLLGAGLLMPVVQRHKSMLLWLHLL
jgi:hypothetical protein